MSVYGFDEDLFRTVADVFRSAVDQAAIFACERDGLSPALWSTVSDLGFPLVGVDETLGGSGGTVLDALAIAVQAGRYAVPLPVVETHLAAWLLTGSGETVDDGPMTVAPGTRRDEVTVTGDSAHGVLYDVPWASNAARIVAFGGDGMLLSLDPSQCRIVAGVDLAGQPRDVVHFDQARRMSAGAALTPRSLMLRGALLRSGQLTGAMDAVTELTVRYCDEREQFGRPLNRFQAVQQHLVTLAQSAELSAMSVLRAGLAALEREASFEISSAKLVADQCAGDAIRATHQAHGAISMTLEYGVQLFTRRLNAWRWEFGAEADLAGHLGQAATHADSFYAVVAAERESPEVSTCLAP